MSSVSTIIPRVVGDEVIATRKKLDGLIQIGGQLVQKFAKGLKCKFKFAQMRGRVPRFRQVTILWYALVYLFILANIFDKIRCKNW